MSPDRQSEPRCPACGAPSVDPPAEVFCVECATEGWREDAARWHTCRAASDADLGDERVDALSAIAREMHYRDALHKVRVDVDRLRVLITLSGRNLVMNEIAATIDAALALGDFGGLPEPGAGGDPYGG